MEKPTDTTEQTVQTITATPVAETTKAGEIINPAVAPAPAVAPKTTNVLDIPATSYFNPDVWMQKKAMAMAFVKSGALPKDDNEFTILMKLQAGDEMGMKPMESVKSFYFVHGAINIFGVAIMRRLREHGWAISYKDEPGKCTVTVTKGKETYSDSLTFEEAEKSKWTTSQTTGLKPGWYDGINRKLKLRYGATSILIKTYIPEVLGSATDIAEVAMDYDIGGVKTPTMVNGDEPATPQQLETLEKMGKEIPEGITKQEALKMLVTKG